jgi:cytochrome c553
MRPMMLMLLITCLSGFAFANESAPSLSGVALVEAKGCVSCHGKDGNGAVLPTTGKIDPQYPLLAGQYASYLEFSLKSYRNGTRKNAVMAGFATALTDAEIKALAKYFSTQDSKLKTLQGVK